MGMFMGTWAPYFLTATVVAFGVSIARLAHARSIAITTLTGFPVGVVLIFVTSVRYRVDFSLGDLTVLLSACLVGGLIGSFPALYTGWLMRVFQNAEPRTLTRR
jgi:hypothetical protein